MRKDPNQLDLFDKSTNGSGVTQFKVPFRKGHDTQQAGAEAASANAGWQARQILHALSKRLDMTDREISEWSGLPLNVVNARRNELEFPSGPADGPAKVMRMRKRNHRFSNVRVWAFAITPAGRKSI